jgi:tRNA(Ile)-lysidine synthase
VLCAPFFTSDLRGGPLRIYLDAMDPVHRDIAAFLRRQRVLRTRPLLVGVSGGADSIALLRALVALGQSCVVAHVHHGLRAAEADDDASFVVAQAAELGVPAHVARVDAAKPDGRSPEARARTLRYAALERLRRSQGCAWTATAHTLEDQAETVLLRATRGTGPAGLAGIAAVDRSRRLLRPVLGVRRGALREYLTTRGFSWREDASNRDPRVPRSRLRMDVLPILESIQPGAVAKLAELAELAREERETSETALDALFHEAVAADGQGAWLADGMLEGCAPAMRRAVLVRFLRTYGPSERLTRRHVERLERFAESGQRGASLSLPGGHAARLDREGLWLGAGPGPAPLPLIDAWLSPPGTLECERRDLRLSWSDTREPRDPGTAWALPRRARGVRVRAARPDDRLVLSPDTSAAPLEQLLEGAGWSARRRAHALVVELDGRVRWVPGLPAAPCADSAGHAWILVADSLSTPI